MAKVYKEALKLLSSNHESDSREGEEKKAMKTAHHRKLSMGL